jgi:hypothetical protein
LALALNAALVLAAQKNVYQNQTKRIPALTVTFTQSKPKKRHNPQTSASFWMPFDSFNPLS